MIRLIELRTRYAGQGLDEKIHACRISSQIMKGRLLGRPSQRREDNIKTVLKILCEGLEWISLSQDRDWLRKVVNRVMNIQV
jgi:hypothetical protein